MEKTLKAVMFCILVALVAIAFSACPGGAGGAGGGGGGGGAGGGGGGGTTPPTNNPPAIELALISDAKVGEQVAISAIFSDPDADDAGRVTATCNVNNSQVGATTIVSPIMASYTCATPGTNAVCCKAIDPHALSDEECETFTCIEDVPKCTDRNADNYNLPAPCTYPNTVVEVCYDPEDLFALWGNISYGQLAADEPTTNLPDDWDGYHDRFVDSGCFQVELHGTDEQVPWAFADITPLINEEMKKYNVDWGNCRIAPVRVRVFHGNGNVNTYGPYSTSEYYYNENGGGGYFIPILDECPSVPTVQNCPAYNGLNCEKPNAVFWCADHSDEEWQCIE